VAADGGFDLAPSTLDLSMESGDLESAPAFVPVSAALTGVRELHTETVLESGKVLIGGGVSAVGSATITSDVFDPAAGTMTSVSMVVERSGHTATLLPSGKVLIAGGSDSTSGLASAELYDPSTGTFSLTGSMGTARFRPCAVLLPSGKVLVAGGGFDSTTGASLASAELYDPSTGTFSPTGSMGVGRVMFTMTALPNGKVLVAGGESGPPSALVNLSSAEIYDPTAGTFAPTGSMATARNRHVAILLPSGKTLVAGGYNGGASASIEAYDFNAGAFSSAGQLGSPRADLAAVLQPTGDVLFAGGAGAVGYLATTELYHPASSVSAPSATMEQARAILTGSLLLDGRSLFCGGRTSSGFDLASCELFLP
jgi:WD40 repeat protein